MLNISENSLLKQLNQERYQSLNAVESKRSGRVLVRLIVVFSITALIIMFLPWTQNISTHGTLTTLRPDQRPQTIHSVIPGRIEKWHVQEGDFVHKGDTILHLSEVKDGYFDPNLLGRTEDQINAKELSVGAYKEKINALDNQIDGLVIKSRLEMEQANNKLRQAILLVTSDSIDLENAKIQYTTAEKQYDRASKMFDQDVGSLTNKENKEMKMQSALAKKISTENKYLASQNKVINARIELNNIETKYRNEVAKAESSKFSAMSSMYDAEATVTKLQNSYTNYSIRTGLYYVTAPQDGYITKTMQSGIGETIKEGEEIISIMPADYDLVVEMYVDPLDLPLIEKGQHVRIQFEGWPAIVFSGWPNTSYGTYGGEVYAIDNFISPNGKYRVLVAPDKDDEPWPDALRVGSASMNMLLLKDVPIWYELWRKINDFPPDYYKQNEDPKKEKEKK